jgi:hypothetical protein
MGQWDYKSAANLGYTVRGISGNATLTATSQGWVDKNQYLDAGAGHPNPNYNTVIIPIAGLDVLSTDANAVPTFTCAGLPVVNLTGTITSSSSTTAIVGVGTAFTTQTFVGAIIAYTGTALGTVTVVTDDTHVTIAANATSTQAGATATTTQKFTDGQVMAFVVTPSEAVNVVGSPSITVAIGSTGNRSFVYNPANSTTTSLSFEYTVVSGDIAATGTTVPVSPIVLSVTGKGKSAIADRLAGGNEEAIPAASLTFSIPSTTGFIVNGV